MTTKAHVFMVKDEHRLEYNRGLVILNAALYNTRAAHAFMEGYCLGSSGSYDAVTIAQFENLPILVRR